MELNAASSSPLAHSLRVTDLQPTHRPSKKDRRSTSPSTPRRAGLSCKGGCDHDLLAQGRFVNMHVKTARANEKHMAKHVAVGLGHMDLLCPLGSPCVPAVSGSGNHSHRRIFARHD
jgi:hypothetical protein